MRVLDLVVWATLIAVAPEVSGQQSSRLAFDVPRFAIADLPSWAESERFDVSARAGASQQQPAPVTETPVRSPPFADEPATSMENDDPRPQQPRQFIRPRVPPIPPPLEP